MIGEHLSIRTKVMGLGVGAALASALTLGVVVWVQSKGLQAGLDAEIEVTARERTSEIAQNVLAMCRSANTFLSRKLAVGGTLLSNALRGGGAPKLASETVEWTATNQRTREAAKHVLPKLMFGELWLGQVASAETPVRFIDEVSAVLPDASATVFQRMNEAGDMLRVATSVKTEGGARALATYISSRDADGRANPVIAKLLAGQEYEGIASIVGDNQAALYRPLVDATGRVIGAYSVSLPATAIDDVKQEVERIVVGKTGYVWVVGGEGDDRGHYIASFQGKRDGENILEAKDATGREFIKSAIDKAFAKQGREIDYEFYPWKNKDETVPRDKIAGLLYFEPWDWVIGASAYVEDFQDARNRATESLQAVMLHGGLAALLVIAVIALVATHLAKLAMQPLVHLIDVADSVSHGDLEVEIDTEGDNEVARLSRALSRVVEHVRLLIDDANDLLSAAHEGDLSKRADPTPHAGGFRRVIEGMNETLDIVAAPVKTTSRYLEQIAIGEFPKAIPERFVGDFVPLKVSLERSVGALRCLDLELRKMIDQQRQGFLRSRCALDGLDGEYRALAVGINGALDMVTEPLLSATELIRQYAAGDLGKEMPSLPNEQAVLSDAVNQIRNNVLALVRDVDAMAQGAIAGNLGVRAESSVHRGQYRKIVEGMNHTLNAVVEPITEARMALERLSHFDLTARVVGTYQGEHAQMKDAVNAAAKVLDEALQEVADAATKVSSASQEIASGSRVVAEGASEQAAALEQTAASLEEMAGKTRENSASTKNAKTLAEHANHSARAGKVVVEKMVGAMERIRTSAESTAQIIRDINEIAFQTNLLALNAAVEAARAGEAGRGFSVVAEEVRNLALRSKEAAERTEALIKESVILATEGGQMSNEVDQTLGDITAAVDNVQQVVSTIAEASLYQAQGIEQVTLAVADMDRSVQQAAASSEESSSAAEDMSAQARALAVTVGRFKLGGRTSDFSPGLSPSSAGSRPQRGSRSMLFS
ncbi:MAG: methyl-accepting chemotaxis protein [Deltaproteobacteria bacterium]|nr:methyl-accepting chemotaxis protein [Deltaproteobacteria bacterium]